MPYTQFNTGSREGDILWDYYEGRGRWLYAMIEGSVITIRECYASPCYCRERGILLYRFVFRGYLE